MARPILSPPAVLDPISRQSIKRFLFGLALFLVWAQVPSARSASEALALMAVCAAAIEAAVGLLAREKLLGESLNRWDVAVAFLGVYYASLIFA
jgi:hypothetical protein